MSQGDANPLRASQEKPPSNLPVAEVRKSAEVDFEAAVASSGRARPELVERGSWLLRLAALTTFAAVGLTLYHLRENLLQVRLEQNSKRQKAAELAAVVKPEVGKGKAPNRRPEPTVDATGIAPPVRRLLPAARPQRTPEEIPTESQAPKPLPPPVPTPAEPPLPTSEPHLLTARLDTPENKAIQTMFADAWNSSYVKARPAIETQRKKLRRAGKVPPVFDYASAVLLLQMGAYSAPEADKLLKSAGEDPMVLLARARMAIRQDKTSVASELTSRAAEGSTCGVLPKAMQDAIRGLAAPPGRPTEPLDSVYERTRKAARSLPVLRAEMLSHTNRSRAELVSLKSRLSVMEATHAELKALEYRMQTANYGTSNRPVAGGFANLAEKNSALRKVQLQIAEIVAQHGAVEEEAQRLDDWIYDETVKVDWRCAAATLPWNADDERQRLASGLTPAEYYNDSWQYLPQPASTLPDKLPADQNSRRRAISGGSGHSPGKAR